MDAGSDHAYSYSHGPTSFFLKLPPTGASSPFVGMVVCLVHKSLVPSYKEISDTENDQQRHSMQHSTLGLNSFAAAGKGYLYLH